MATMIPAEIPGAPQAEQTVFNLLRDDPATADWVVMHRVKTLAADQRERTIDFVAMVPDSAILCIEVRGGGFEVKSGQWYALSTRELVEPPGRQVEKAMYALEDQLRLRFPDWNGDYDLRMDSVVLFTDTTWPSHLRPLAYPAVGLPDLATYACKTLGERLSEIAAGIRDDLPDSPRLDQSSIKTIQGRLTTEFTPASPTTAVA